MREVRPLRCALPSSEYLATPGLLEDQIPSPRSWPHNPQIRQRRAPRTSVLLESFNPPRAKLYRRRISSQVGDLAMNLPSEVPEYLQSGKLVIGDPSLRERARPRGARDDSQNQIEPESDIRHPSGTTCTSTHARNFQKGDEWLRVSDSRPSLYSELVWVSPET